MRAQKLADWLRLVGSSGEGMTTSTTLTHHHHGRVIQQRAESLGFSKTLGVLALMIELVSMPNRGIVTTHFRVAGRCEDAARWGLQLLTAPAK
jgi:hypothetical protein